MTGAVAPEPRATAPQERSWRWFVLALACMMAITLVPAWPPALALFGGAIRLLLPIEQFALLVLAGLASCALVGWWSGGGLLTAVGWSAVAGWVLWQLPLPMHGMGAFVRGWTLALGAAFGLVCLATEGRPFLGRALSAVGLAGAVTVAGLLVRAPDGPTSLERATRMLGLEQQRRTAEALGVWQARAESSVWRAVAQRVPELSSRAEQLAAQLESVAQPAGSGVLRSEVAGPLALLAPALLGLESLLALALAWTAYHRLARVRLGPPLATVRTMRFNDQLVWGVLVGGIIALLPTLADWRVVGVNLMLFFGALYALRGAGVLLWWVPDRLAWLLPLGLAVLVVLLGPVLVVAAVLAATVSVGLGDTWRDFRAGAPSRRPSSLR